MKYKDVADFYKIHIATGRPIEDLVVDAYYPLPYEEIRARLEQVKAILKEVKEELGPMASPKQVYEYLKAPRDTIDFNVVDENGKEKNIGTIEGNIQFDPSHKSDMTNTPIQDNSVIKFGDTNVIYENDEYVSPVEFGDSSTNPKNDDLATDDELMGYGKTVLNDFGSKPSDDIMFGDEFSNPKDNIKIVRPGEENKKKKEVNVDDIKFGDEPSKEEPKKDMNDDVSILYYGDIAHVDFEKPEEPDVKFGDEDNKPKKKDDDDDNFGGPDVGGFTGPKFGGF